MSWSWAGSSRRSASPPGSTGCRLDSGSWKIMPISAPRIARSSAAVMVSRSRPSNRAWPVIWAPRVRPMIVWVETLLPDPDSPTMPSVCPASTAKETPRTACTTPSVVGTRRAGLRPRAAPRATHPSPPQDPGSACSRSPDRAMTVIPAGCPAVDTAGRPVDSISVRSVTNACEPHGTNASGIIPACTARRSSGRTAGSPGRTPHCARSWRDTAAGSGGSGRTARPS